MDAKQVLFDQWHVLTQLYFEQRKLLDKLIEDYYCWLTDESYDAIWRETDKLDAIFNLCHEVGQEVIAAGLTPLTIRSPKAHLFN